MRVIAINAILGTIGAAILVGFVGGMVVEKLYEKLTERKGSAS